MLVMFQRLRLDEANRIIYKIGNGRMIIAQCDVHYGDT